MDRRVPSGSPLASTIHSTLRLEHSQWRLPRRSETKAGRASAILTTLQDYGSAGQLDSSGPADQRVTLEAPIRKLRIVEREVQTAAFLSTEGRIDYQRGDRRKVAELEQVD